MICFIILTDLTKFFVEFCVDEVFEERGVTDVRRIKRGKRSSLGMPKAPQVNILRILKHLSLGMPRLASHLSSSTIIGIPRFLFCSHDLCPLCFYFSLRTMLVWDVPSSIYRMIHVLHLYILSLDIGLSIYIEECSMNFTYILLRIVWWSLLCFTYILRENVEWTECHKTWN